MIKTTTSSPLLLMVECFRRVFGLGESALFESDTRVFAIGVMRITQRCLLTIFGLNIRRFGIWMIIRMIQAEAMIAPFRYRYDW